MPNTGLTGSAILAGGLSRRMGVNKALLRLRADGPTLIETVVACLIDAGLGDGLLIVANAQEEYAFLGLPVVRDDIPNVGPLGGVLTALSHSQYARVVVVACDMPMLNPTLLWHIASLPDDSDVIMPRWVDRQGAVRLETLHALYSRRCIEPIRARIKAGNLQANELVQDVTTRYIEEAELRRFDPNLSSFRNLNALEDIDASAEC